MSRVFATTLKRKIDEEHEGNASAYSREAGLTQSGVAYYTRPGKNGRFPSPENLEKLLQPFSRKARQELMVAYYGDLTPPSGNGLVKVSIAGKGEKALTATPETGVKLPAKTEKAFTTLRELAAESVDIRRFIESTAKTMQG